MARDLHKEPFSEETLTKLEIFRLYLQGWLPVFLNTNTRRINIFDFYCGPGKDVANVSGSPLITLDIIERYSGIIDRNIHDIHLYFNDKTKWKIEELESTINERGFNLASIHYSNKKFIDIFSEKYTEMASNEAANFIFIDPNGFVPHDILMQIAKLKKTDMLFFIPSSFAKRFCDHEYVKDKIPDFKCGGLKSPMHVHIAMCDYYKSKILSKNSRYYLSPFSIKKQKNVYGLIYGGSNLRGLEKFLEATWKVDPILGEANISIEGDFSDIKQRLLPGLEPIKTQKFKAYLESKIINGEIDNHRDIYEQTLLKGFLPKHANEILHSLAKSGFIEKTCAVSYSTYKKCVRITRLVHG